MPEGRRATILRSGALRLAAVFALVFAAVAVLYVAGVHVAVRRYAVSTLRLAVEREVDLLRDAARGSADGLARRTDGHAGGHVGVFAADGRRLSGDLPAVAAKEGWSGIQVQGAADEGEPVEVLARGVRLADGGLLVVGRDLSQVADLIEWLDGAALWSASGVVVLALLAGWLIASSFLRRVDALGAAMDRIAAGAYAERLPAIGMGAEFDALASRVNAMLDRIIALMEGQRDLSGHLAHELRTPLTRVHQRVEAARALARDPVVCDALDEAQRQVESLRDVFSALLRLATIERGALRGRFARVDLCPLARTLAEVFGAPAEDRGKSLVVTAPPGPVVVMGDADLIAQLLANLVDNALVHSGAGTRITVEVAPRGGRAGIVVEDDGPGVSASERALVVQRFGRSGSTTSPGAGLGLALVDAIATLHGGTLVLADATPGLRAQVAFPLAPGPGGDAGAVGS